MNRFAALLLILIAGSMFRCYNLDSPSIGYHNMRENESLSVAQEMLASGDLLHKRLYFENSFSSDPVIRGARQPQLVPYQIILSWKLFGENLWGARLFNVVFGIAAVIVIYFIAQALFMNVTLALASAAILAVIPLAVFFSRNLQGESPAFFFMLLGNLFYLRFIRSRKKYNLTAGGVSFIISFLYSSNFIFGALPLFFCFPYGDIAKSRKGLLNFSLSLFLPFAALGLFYMWPLGGEGIGPAHNILKAEIFSPDYWRQHASVISWYTKTENFTAVFSVLALLGTVLAFLRGSGTLNRYIMGWAFCAIIYASVFAEQLYQQNFIQMPFLAMVAISSVYAIGYMAESMKGAVKKDLLVYLLAAAVITGGYLSYKSVQRMHSVSFLGQDVAGESLKELTRGTERVFLNTYAQGYAIARYAQRYVGWASDLEQFKKKEKEFDIRYICFYPAEFARNLQNDNPGLFEYIKENYHAKEAGFTEEPSKLFYIILERGRSKDPEKLLEAFSGPKKLRTIYKVSGRYIFFYSISVSEKGGGSA